MPLLHRSTFLIGTFLIGFLAFGWIRAVKSADGPAKEETGFLRHLQKEDVGAFCEICKNGGFPGTPSTVTAVLYIPGNPTCGQLYEMGQNSQIPSRLCKPIRASILQADCGCDKSTAPPGGGGSQPGGSLPGASASSSSPPGTASTMPAVTVPTVTVPTVASPGGSSSSPGDSSSSPANVAGNAAGNNIASNIGGGVSGLNFVGNLDFAGPSFVPFAGVDFSGVGGSGAGVDFSGVGGSGAGVDFSGVGGSGAGSIAAVVPAAGNLAGSCGPPAGNVGGSAVPPAGNLAGSVVPSAGNLDFSGVGIGQVGGLLNSGLFDVSAALDSFNSLAPVPLP
jgi:hypothetical protein